MDYEPRSVSMGKGRLEAFSDGVIAIVITISTGFNLSGFVREIEPGEPVPPPPPAADEVPHEPAANPPATVASDEGMPRPRPTGQLRLF
jgi:hypothetical protein